ncbi:PLP-dependent aminotransferase family protein [Micromonospora zhanjiangensis]
MVQFRARPDVIDLGWGHPHPAALPTDAWATATAGALRRYGSAALSYGYAAGPGPLVEWLTERLGRVDAYRPEADQVFVTAGASQALDLLAGAVCRPGDAVLVDAPTYHLALRIVADHRVDLVAAPTDRDGLDPAGTAELVRSLRRRGRRVPMLYLVPTFNNPTGRSLPSDRRAGLVAMAEEAGLLVVEDDTYRELSYDGPAPASLFSTAATGTVARVGSFSKTVAPGLRLGWLTADAGLVAGLHRRGHVDSGGGVNHTTALTMAEFAADGGYDRHLSGILARYRRQRDALVTAVRRHLPDARFDVPGGGWFLWLRSGADRVDLPGPDELLARAEAAGVSYLEGTWFYPGRAAGRDRIRLSFSRLDPAELAEGVRRLAGALTDGDA